MDSFSGTTPGPRQDDIAADYQSTPDPLDNLAAEMHFLDATERYRQLAILADAGMGKSWLLYQHAINLAAAAGASLTSRTANVQTVSIPVLLRADALANAYRPGDNLTSAAVRALTHAGSAISESLHRCLVACCESGPAVYLIDALDEATPEQHVILAELLAATTNPKARYVVTSRVAEYTGVFRSSERVEAELLPFAYPLPYVDSWNLPEDRRAALLTRMEDPAVAQLARVPLFLAFLCHLASTTTTRFPNTRAELYERIMRRFLSAEQRPHRPNTRAAQQNPLSSNPNTRADQILAILRPLAYQIATQQEGWLDTIGHDALLGHLQKVLPDIPLLPPGLDPAIALTLLTQDTGIFVPAGSAAHGRTPHYGFVHRSLVEYLVAAYVAGSREVTESCARHHLHLAYDWRETWLLTAQINPTETLEILTDHPKDVLFIALITAAAAIRELTAQQRATVADQVQAVLDRSIAVLTNEAESYWARGLVTEALRDVGGQAAIEALAGAIHDPAPIVGGRCLGALGAIGDSAAVAILCAASSLDFSSKVIAVEPCGKMRCEVAFAVTGRVGVLPCRREVRAFPGPVGLS